MNINEYKHLYPNYNSQVYSVQASTCTFSTIFPVDRILQPRPEPSGVYRFYLLDHGIGTNNEWYATVPVESEEVLFLKTTANIDPTNKLLKPNTELARAEPSLSGEEINWLKQTFNTVYIDKRYGEYQLSLLTNTQILSSSVGEYVSSSGKYLEATKKFLEFAGKDQNYFSTQNAKLNPVSVREYHFPIRSCSYLQLLFSVPISLIESTDITPDESVLNLITNKNKLNNIPNSSRFLFTKSNVKKSYNYNEYTEKVSKLISDLRFVDKLNSSLTNPVNINLELDIVSLLSLVAGIQNIFNLNGLQFSQDIGKIVGLLEKNEEDIKLSYVNLDTDPINRMSVGVKQFINSYSYNNQNIMYLLYNAEDINSYVDELVQKQNIISGNSIATFYDRFYDKRAFTEETLNSIKNASENDEQIAIKQSDPNTSENCTVQGNIQKLRDQYDNFTSLRNSIRSNVNSTFGNPALEILVGDLKEVNTRESKPYGERLKEEISKSGRVFAESPQARAYVAFRDYPISDTSEPPPVDPKESKLSKAKRDLDAAKNEIERFRTKISLGVNVLKAFRADEILFALYECRTGNIDPLLLQGILSKYLSAKEKIDKFINTIVCNDYVSYATKIPRFNVPGGLATSDPLETITREISKALYNAIIDLILISIRGSLEAFADNTCDTNNLANLQDTGLSVGDLTAEQESLVGDVLSQNGISRDDLSSFTSFLNDVLCVLKPNEICLLLSGNTLGLEQRLIIRSLIINKYTNLTRFAENEDLLLSLCKSIIEKLNLTTICLDILSAQTPFNRQFCDFNTLNNARRQLLEQKSLSPEQIDELINAIKEQEAKDVENTVKLLNGDVPNTLPNLLCTEDSTKGLLADIVNKNPAVQSMYSSLIKSMIKPLYPVYNQDLIDWPSSIVTNEKLVKQKGSDAFNRPEILLRNPNIEFENASENGNTKTVKHIAESFTDIKTASIVTDNNYKSTFDIDSEKQYKLDYGLAYEDIDYRNFTQININLKTTFAKFSVNLLDKAISTIGDTAKTLSDLANGAEKLSKYSEQGVIGEVANSYDLIANFFDNMNIIAQEVPGYDDLSNAVKEYKDFKKQKDNALVNNYAKYKVTYNYSLLDTQKQNILQIERNGINSFFTSSELHSIQFSDPNKDNRVEYLNNLNISTDQQFLENLKNANKKAFTDIISKKQNKQDNYYLVDRPYNSSDKSSYLLAFAELEQYLKLKNQISSSYSQYYDQAPLIPYTNLRNTSTSVTPLFTDVLNPSLKPIYQNSDLEYLKSENPYISYIGDCIMLVSHVIRETYIEARKSIAEVVNSNSTLLNSQLINSSTSESILSLLLLNRFDLQNSNDETKTNARNIFDIILNNNIPKDVFFSIYQTLLQRTGRNQKEELQKIFKLDKVLERFNNDKIGYGFTKESNNVKIIEVFENFSYFSIAPDDGILKKNTNFIFANLNFPSTLEKNKENIDLSKCLIESLVFTDKKSTKDKICNTENSFLGLDKSESNINKEKQNNICYDSQNDSPNFVSQESTIILKELSNIIIRAYVYDFLMQGIVSFHDITPKAIKNNMMINFILFKMKSEMGKLSVSYFDTFLAKLYNIYTGSNQFNFDNALTIIKARISDEIDSFTEAYFNNKDGVLIKSPVLNYTNQSSQNLNTFSIIYDNLILEEGVGLNIPQKFKRYRVFDLNFCLDMFGDDDDDVDKVFLNKPAFETIVGFYYKIMNMVHMTLLNNNITNATFNIDQIVKKDIERVYKKENDPIIMENNIFAYNNSSTRLNLQEYNNLFDALFPLKDYYVCSFILANLSTSVSKKGTTVFRDTHSSLLITYNNLLNGANADVSVPLVTNSNSPSTVGKFAFNALVKTPLMIAKGAVEALDPNVATAKALSEFTKQSALLINPELSEKEKKNFDYLVPTYGGSLSAVGILPTPIGIAYYLSTLWSSDLLGNVIDSDNDTGNTPLTCEDENA